MITLPGFIEGLVAYPGSRKAEFGHKCHQLLLGSIVDIALEPSPFCRLVRERLCELELPYRLHNVARGSARRQAFEARGEMTRYTADVTTLIAFGGLSWALDGAAAPAASFIRPRLRLSAKRDSW